MHKVAATSNTFVQAWARDISRDWGITVYLYVPVANVFKYPTMRRILRDAADPVCDYVMWFDDDSYIHNATHFWHSTIGQMSDCDMLGQHWYWPPKGAQWEWVKAQPWYNPEVGVPADFRGKPCFRFCQGAWWTARTAMLRELDWPVPELRHCGGDSMLGEVMRHAGYRMKSYFSGVKINADRSGAHSRSERRGYSELPIGADYIGQTYSTAHQEFEIDKITVISGEALCTKL